MITIDNVSYRYPGVEDDRWALRQVSLNVAPNEFVAFLGPNGSGKSTLTRLLNGIALPDEGTVKVDGLPTDEVKALSQIRRQVQVVFQNPENQQVGITLAEDIAFGLSNIQCPHEEMQERIHWALRQVGLHHDPDRLVSELSGGEKQKLALASVLVLSPQYLILDEATSMLDPMSRKQFLEALHEVRSRVPFTLIYITHHLEEVLEADRLVLFVKGAVVAEGKPAELLSEPGMLAACGLEIPYVPALAHELRKLGLAAPDLPTIDSVVNALCS